MESPTNDEPTHQVHERHTHSIPPLQWCSSLLNRVGINARWGGPEPVIQKQPSKLQNSTVK